LSQHATTNDAITFDVVLHEVDAGEVAYRERLVHESRFRHWTMLGLSTAIIVIAFLLQTEKSGQVAPAWWPGLKLPVMCGSRSIFGVECPGCGLTRSFVALAGGDVAASLRYHRVGWVLFLAVLLQFPYRIIALRELRIGPVERSWPVWFGWALIGLLVFNWLAKNAGI
jgi:hypothetical protein